jgi:hypothetical protein
MADIVLETLVDALKQALAEPGEQRLFKSGKLDGLFASRSGANAQAATQAVRDGLMEVVRTEMKGKTTIEWVRATPRGLEFLHEHESPVRALRDLQAILQINRQQIPLWLEEMRTHVQILGNKLAEEATCWTHRLLALSQQVEEALRRADAREPTVSDSAAADAPWATQALTYLDRRRERGMNGPCSLPELFAALHEQHPDLSLTAFHDRLRRLCDRKVLRLLAFEGPPSDMPEPEFALLDGARLLYFVNR